MRKALMLLILLFVGTVPAATSGRFSEKEIVAITILAEARGEGEAGMYAVACVIAQRSVERKISPAKVCTQKFQFSCWNANDPQRHKLGSLLKLSQAEYALRLAENIMGLDRSFVGYANHYHADSVKPYWAKKETPTKIVGNHIFYKL